MDSKMQLSFIQSCIAVVFTFVKLRASGSHYVSKVGLKRNMRSRITTMTLLGTTECENLMCPSRSWIVCVFSPPLTLSFPCIASRHGIVTESTFPIVIELSQENFKLWGYCREYVEHIPWCPSLLQYWRIHWGTPRSWRLTALTLFVALMSAPCSTRILPNSNLSALAAIWRDVSPSCNIRVRAINVI